ncbi:hypothetical protein M2R48_11475 [Acinetobacter sp. I-MWF]|uniref:hypothetical protein n=1 Tax=Acinetobacter TaxID=469 RepID=UPI0021CA408C|nr:hypothetical protein [Acinetobacter sp. I-MWF]MCT9978950.1 hypothetical protein [Acinetobacter sp. I-MWF]
MKTNFSVDLALLFTALSIFLYACGYFYIKNYVGYFGYSHHSLGYDFQNYLITGGLQGVKGLMFSFILLLLISLANTLTNKNISKSFIKGGLYIATFLFVLIFNILFYTIIKPFLFILKIPYYIISIFSDFLYRKFPILCHYIEIVLIIIILLLGLFFALITYPLKLLFRKTHNTSKNEINWNDSIDTQNIDKGFKEIIYYYAYLIVFYLLILITVFYLAGIEKKGTSDAINQFIYSDTNSISIKDDSIDYLFKSQRLTTPKFLNVKFMTCGTNKCLILIDANKNIDISFTKQGLIIFKNPYFHKTISNSDYTLID